MADKPPSIQRKAFEERSQLKLQQGKVLANAGNYSAALTKFLQIEKDVHLWCTADFQYSAVVACISKIAKNYPPALKSLKRRRDKKEKLISTNTETDWNLHNEWISMNYFLEGDDYTLNFLKNAKLADNVYTVLSRQTIKAIWQRLVQKKRYSELTEDFEMLGSSWMTLIARHETEVVFPTFNGTEKQRLKWLKNSEKEIVKRGTALYKLALGLKKEDSSVGIANRLKEINSTVDMQHE